LSKPVDIMRLDTVLNKWVRKKSTENVPGTTAPSPQAAPSPPPPSPAPASGQAELPPPSGITVDIPGIDDKRASYLYDDDMDIFIPVLRSYAAHSLDYLEKLRHATEEGLPDCVIIAHGIKGASANICAEAVRAAAAEMEANARKGDFAKFMALRDSFLKDAGKLIDNINAWLENYDKNNLKPVHDAPSAETLKELRKCCETYDMTGIDKAMDALESFIYKDGGDLVAWLREKIDMMEVGEVVTRLSKPNPFV